MMLTKKGEAFSFANDTTVNDKKFSVCVTQQHFTMCGIERLP